MQKLNYFHCGIIGYRHSFIPRRNYNKSDHLWAQIQIVAEVPFLLLIAHQQSAE